MYYWAASKVAPLAAWPDGFVPWVVEGLTSLRSEMDKAEAAIMKSITDGR